MSHLKYAVDLCASKVPLSGAFIFAIRIVWLEVLKVSPSITVVTYAEYSFIFLPLLKNEL